MGKKTSAQESEKIIKRKYFQIFTLSVLMCLTVFQCSQCQTEVEITGKNVDFLTTCDTSGGK